MPQGPWKTFRLDEHPDYEQLPKDFCSLTMLEGPTQGAVQPVVDGEMILGRDESLPSRIDDRGLSRRHARVYFVLGEWCLEDLDSTNGTRLNGERVGSLPERLEDGDRIQIGERTVLRVTLMDAAEAEAAQKMYESAVRDALTGAYNRGHFDERLRAEFAYARRHEAPLSLILFDLDHFKALNDTHGHQAGDATLVAVADAVQGTLRQEDVFARYGGEEFVIIARLEATAALRLAERLRAIVEALLVETGGLELRVTASFGLATIDAENPFERPEELIAAADAAAYRAKDEGRNRVSLP